MRGAIVIGCGLVLVAGVAPGVMPVGGLVAQAAPRVAMPFDFDGDGFADLTVGIPNEDIGSRRDAGAVQVLYGSRSGPTARDQLWHQNRKGVKGVAAAADLFGEALASGDFDADGYADLAIGVPGKTFGFKDAAGAVQVLYGGPKGLTARDQLWHQDSAGVPGQDKEGGFFGGTLAAGDFNGDGRVDLAMGAADDSVVVLQGSGGGLTSTGAQLWALSTPGMAHRPGVVATAFGSALAAGDVNGDGRDDLAVADGSETSDPEVAVGAVHLLYGSPTGLTVTGNQFLTAEDLGYLMLNQLANGLADLAMGDFNADGRADLVVGDGASSETGSSENIAVVYAGPGGLVASGLQKWILDRDRDPQEGDTWDQDAFASGDLTGDGIDDLAVGADGMALGGSVHVLAGSSAGLVGPWTTITQDSPGVPGKSERGDYFGDHVAILPLAGGSTGWLVVGSPGEGLSSAGLAEGRVVVIPGRSGGLNLSAAKGWHQDSAGIKGAAEKGDHFGRTVGVGRHSTHNTFS